MGFKITKDNVHNKEEYKAWECVGKTYGGYKGGKHKFRILDDDKNIYFYGVSDSDSSFQPLDWASPQWGASEIQYRNEDTKEYETL